MRIFPFVPEVDEGKIETGGENMVSCKFPETNPTNLRILSSSFLSCAGEIPLPVGVLAKVKASIYNEIRSHLWCM